MVVKISLEVLWQWYVCWVHVHYLRRSIGTRPCLVKSFGQGIWSRRHYYLLCKICGQANAGQDIELVLNLIAFTIIFCKFNLNIVDTNDLVRLVSVRHCGFSANCWNFEFFTDWALEVTNDPFDDLGRLASVCKAQHLFRRGMSGVHMQFGYDGFGLIFGYLQNFLGYISAHEDKLRPLYFPSRCACSCFPSHLHDWSALARHGDVVTIRVGLRTG